MSALVTSRVRLFGLTIDSELPLPGLELAAEGRTPDVFVRRGAFNKNEPGIVTTEIGYFAVRCGNEIIFDALPGISQRNIRMYLLGSAMGLLLHQRGLFPLHANAVAFNGGVLAVAGASGAGKSTLAFWFLQNGLALLGDDVLALQVTPDRALALPGLPQVRLWREALNCFGLDSKGLEQSFVDADYDKWDLPVAKSALTSENMPLTAVYVLEDGEEIGFERLTGAARVSALFDHTYRGDYIDLLSASATHWQAVTRLASLVPVFRLQRPRDLSRLADLGRAVLVHARYRTC